MGTYINELGKFYITENEKAAFLADAKTVAEQGGLFLRCDVSAFGKHLELLRSPEYDNGEECADYTYSYYESTAWENAGIDLEDFHLYSGKIGWKQFNLAVQALYILAELYSGTFYCTTNDSTNCQNSAIQWLRYLLKRELYYTWRNDLWSILEELAKDTAKYEGGEAVLPYSVVDKYICDETIPGTIIKATLALHKMDELTNEDAIGWVPKSKIAIANSFLDLYDKIKDYKDESELSEDEQVELLLDCLRKPVKEVEESNIECAGIAFCMLNVPTQGSVRIISELYGRNFWKLWWRLDDKTKNENDRLLASGFEPEVDKAISTEEYFGIKSEDRLYWWREGGDVVLTEETKAWLRRLNERRKELLNSDLLSGDILSWQKRFVSLLNDNPDELCFEELFYRLLGGFHNPNNRASVLILEENADDHRRYRQLIAVLANEKLYKKVFVD